MENLMSDDQITRKDLLDLEERLIGKLSSKEELKQETAKLATKEELKQETAKLATKEELKQEIAKLATKEELKQETAKLATKEELKQETAKLATKEELKQEIAKLATKEELRQETAKLATREAVDVLANQVLKNTNDIEVIKYKIIQIDRKIDSMDSKFDNKFDIIITAVDNIARELADFRTEKLAINSALNRHEKKINDHEVRVSKLEHQTC